MAHPAPDMSYVAHDAPSPVKDLMLDVMEGMTQVAKSMALNVTEADASEVAEGMGLDTSGKGF